MQIIVLSFEVILLLLYNIVFIHQNSNCRKNYERNRSEKRAKDPVHFLLNQDVTRRCTYNFGTTQYNKACVDQDNRCAMCHVESYDLCIDHNHIDLSVRDLLCQGCNAGFEQLKENEIYMNSAVNYLLKHQDT